MRSNSANSASSAVNRLCFCAAEIAMKRPATSVFVLLLIGVALTQNRPAQNPPSARSQGTVPAAADARTEAIRLNNLAAAYMGQQKFEPALKLFEQAYKLDPRLQVARLNQGIALLNLQRADAARQVLDEFLKKNPQSARAWYNLGLLTKNSGHAKSAVEAFRRAAELAPNDADAWYFLGASYAQLQQDKEAIAAFQRALQLNPFHVSAEFGLARACQHTGQVEEARKHLQRFQHLTQTRLGAPISLAYGDQGPLSLAETLRAEAQPAPETVKVTFTDATKEAGLPSERAISFRGLQESVACFLDYDNDGLPDLFLSNAGQAGSALYHNTGKGGFANVTRAAGLDGSAHPGACAAADYDNDGYSDLVLATQAKLVLLHNEKNGTLRDATTESGLKGSATSLTWVDYDHDGDADLYATERSGTSLWRNNGNGTFIQFGKETGLASEHAEGAILTDFNNDRAVDLVVTSPSAQPLLFLNPREGKWNPADVWPPSVPRGSTTVAVLDFNKDGWMDLAFTHPHPPGLTLWRNVQGQRLEEVPLPDLHWTAGYSVVAFDYDNDGHIDLAVLGQKANSPGELRSPARPGTAAPARASDQSASRIELRILRNEGTRFVDVSSEVGLDKLQLRDARGLVYADYDADGDTDLLITRLNAPPVLLRNDGGNQNNWVRISLKGLNDNKSGIGTKVEVFAGDLWQKWEVATGGGSGQSSLDIIVGLGKRKQADVVRLLWPTGVVQDETELAANKTSAITEIDRRGSSCPILFAWDGARYRFVSDMIGAGVVGHWIAPGERNLADPTEYLKLEDFAAQPRNGKLSFRFMEPMEEVVYLDQVRLLAVDHSADVQVFPNERFLSNPPYPEFKVIASQNAQPPARALFYRDAIQSAPAPGPPPAPASSRKIKNQKPKPPTDVTAAIRESDRRYVSGFELLNFKGFTRPHTLELDLADAYVGGPLRLLMRGYIEYFTATSMFAAHQAGISPVAPYVEALDEACAAKSTMRPPAQSSVIRSERERAKQASAGRRTPVASSSATCWTRVLDDMGFPAGLPRTIVVDLSGRLPAGTHKVRITTNLQIYWDQVLVDRSTPEPQVQVSEVPLAAARLAAHGFPRAVEGGSPGDLTYVYEDASPSGPYVRQVGAYTGLGDVRALLSESDDRFTIFGPGDEVQLEFDPAALPPLPTGWKRDYFFFADGFEKDMDFYAAHALTVEPLPYHAMGVYPPARSLDPPLDYMLDYNTRFFSGRPPADFRFQFRSASPPSPTRKSDPR